MISHGKYTCGAVSNFSSSTRVPEIFSTTKYFSLFVNDHWIRPGGGLIITRGVEDKEKPWEINHEKKIPVHTNFETVIFLRSKVSACNPNARTGTTRWSLFSPRAICIALNLPVLVRSLKLLRWAWIGKYLDGWPSRPLLDWVEGPTQAEVRYCWYNW